MTTAPKMPDASVPCNPVFVSEVIGDGADAHREVRVGDWTLTAPGANGTDPLVRDLDIGRRVYPNAKPHKIRERIRALIAEGDPNFRPLEVLPHRGKTSSGGRPASEFMLSEHEAVFLVSQIDTPAARSMTHAMIRVFRAAVLRRRVPVLRPRVVRPRVLRGSILRPGVLVLRRARVRRAERGIGPGDHRGRDERQRAEPEREDGEAWPPPGRRSPRSRALPPEAHHRRILRARFANSSRSGATKLSSVRTIAESRLSFLNSFSLSCRTRSIVFL